MTILGFSTSTDTNSLALFKAGHTISEYSWARKEQQSEALTLHIKNYLKKNKVEFSDLELIAVDKGPGSFTGCRIAVNIAKTLSFDLGIKVFATHSLDLLAFGGSREIQKSQPFTILSVLDAHRALFYFRKYEVTGPLNFSYKEKILALSLDEIAQKNFDAQPIYLLGNLTKEYFTELSEKLSKTYPKDKIIIPKDRALHIPRAQSLVELASQAPASSHLPWSVVEPSYIRAPDAVQKFQS